MSIQTTTLTPKPLLSAFVTETESIYNLPFLLPSLRHTTKIPASTCSYLMAALPLTAYSKGEAKNPVLESFKSSFSRVWPCSQNISRLPCTDPATLSLHTEPKGQSFSLCRSRRLSRLDGTSCPLLSPEPVAHTVFGLSSWMEPECGFLSSSVPPGSIQCGVAPSSPAEGQAMGFFLHSEPDGRAGEVKSNSLRPKKLRGAMSVGEREGSWCSRPFGNCSKDFGYKKYKSWFWEHPGPCCSSPARASSWILHKTCWCRSPSLCGLVLQNSKHKTFKQ